LMASSLRRQRSFFEFAGELKENELQVMRELFEMCDENKDGRLSRRELVKVMKEMNIDADQDQIDTLFTHLDQKKMGYLNFSDFARGMQWIQQGILALKDESTESQPSGSVLPLPRRKSLAKFVEEFSPSESVSRAHAMELFNMCDKDGDGQITIEELSSVMKELNVQTTRAQVKFLFHQLDQNHDGVISLSEFSSGISHLHQAIDLSQKLSSGSFDSETKSKPSLDSDRRCEILIQFVGDFVEKIVKKAEDECTQGNVETAKALMQLVHFSGLGAVEKQLDQQLCSEYTVANYKRIVRLISENLKKE